MGSRGGLSDRSTWTLTGSELPAFPGCIKPSAVIVYRRGRASGLILMENRYGGAVSTGLSPSAGSPTIEISRKADAGEASTTTVIVWPAYTTVPSFGSVILRVCAGSTPTEAFLTVTGTTAESPLYSTVILAKPNPVVVTRPSPVTVATSGLSEVNLT